MDTPLDVDNYISSFPADIQKKLQQVRQTIKAAAPTAEEVISYQIPAYKLNGMLVFFAAYPKHVGFYPTPSGIKHFKEELSVFKGAKGSVQFPLDKPMPVELIEKIVKFRVQENMERTIAKKK